MTLPRVSSPGAGPLTAPRSTLRRLVIAWGLLTFPCAAQPEKTHPEPKKERNAPLVPATDAALPEYWEDANARTFVSTFLMAGYYSELTGSVGWGKPFWLWGGIAGSVMGYPGMSAIAFGPRFELLVANLSVRVRRTWSTASFSPRRDVYTDASFRDAEQARAHYTSYDADLWGYVPLGPTLSFWALRGVWIPELGTEQALHSEMLRYVVEDRPIVMGQWISWGAFLNETLYLGPAADITADGSRQALLRLGASAMYSFGPHLTAEVMLTVPVLGPDELHFTNEIWGNVDLSWAWASGEPAPSLF